MVVDFGSRLVDALGLKGRLISRVQLNVQACQIPEVTITEEIRQGDEFVALVSQYKLVPKDLP